MGETGSATRTADAPARAGQAAARAAGRPARRTRHVFSITGAASADLPLRVLNLFARQGLLLDTVRVTRAGDRHAMTVRLGGLTPDAAAILAEKMRVMVQVESIALQAVPGGGAATD